MIPIAIGTGLSLALAAQAFADATSRGLDWSAVSSPVVNTLVGSLLFGSFALLLIIGVAVRFVPFVAISGAVAGPVGRMQADEVVPVHTTGVVGLERRKKRYRHRPAVLERRVDGELHLIVRFPGLASADIKGPLSTAASARLTSATVSNVSRGSAYFATEIKPAVRLTWTNGPLILDFDDPGTRDRVYGELSSWPKPVVS